MHIKNERLIRKAVKGIKSTTLFARILLMLLLALLIFYGYSVYLNLASQRRADREFMATIHDKMQYYISNLESEIERINLAQEQFSNNIDINLLSIDDHQVLSNYERLTMIRDIQTYLLQFYNTNNLLKNTELHIAAMGKTIDCFHSIRDMDREKFQYLSEHYRESGSVLCYYEGQLLIVKPYPVAGIGEKDPLYIASSEIDLKTLQRQIDDLSENSFSNMYLASEDQSWVAGDTALYDSTYGELDTKTYWESDGKKYYVDRVWSETLGVTMYSFIPQDIVRRNSMLYTALFGIFTAAAVLITLLIYHQLNRMLGKPMKELMNAFNIVKNGRLDYQIEHNREDEFAFLYNNFNEMIGNIDVLTHEVARQEKLVVKAELKQLQYQINPHFLYNSLYMIYRLARKGENERIEELAQYLGGYYRYITRSSSKLVPIREEIEHCRKYVNIQRIRFMGRVEVTFQELDRKYDGFLIPVLIFQPVIENAFEHGVENMESMGRIDIYFEVCEPIIRFVVEDNGEGIDGDKLQAMIEEAGRDSQKAVSGLVNVYKRIRGYFGSQGGLRIEQSRYGGTRVVLELIWKDGMECTI